MSSSKCLLALVCMSIQPVKAQKSNPAQTLLNEKCKHQYMSLSSRKIKDNEKEAFPFQSIEVVDYRADSTRIGMFVANGQQYDLLFKSPVSVVISSFFNENYTHPSATKTLLVVIRTLWCSDVIFKEESAAVSTSFNSRIGFHAETYIKESKGYIPLASFDTVITTKKAVIEVAPFRLPALMASFIEKINSLEMQSVSSETRRMVSYAFIDSFSRKNFLHPIITADTLRKGVYASFEEFRNNRPSVFNYEIGQEDDSQITLNLKDEQGKSYYSRKLWGFCDGQATYVMIDGSLFPLFNYNHAYYIYGFREYVRKKKSGPGLVISTSPFYVLPLPGFFYKPTGTSKVVRNFRFFTLDMETGEIY